MNGYINLDNSIDFVEKYQIKNQDVQNFTSIIILTYNQLEYTKLCIASIKKFTYENSYEIIVVDNNSTDGTVEWLKEQNDLKIIFNNENQGFPKGCNQGIEISSGKNIVLLNNDVIVTPNWLYNMDKALWSNKDIGAVGAITNNCSYYQEIKVDYNSIEELIEFSNKINQSNENYWEYRIKLVGFCMVIKKEVLDKVGLLDEIFSPGNFEDDDICFRMIQNGYKLFLCKDTFIHHFGSISFREDIWRYNEILKSNRLKFMEKWKFSVEYSNNIRFDLIDMIEEQKDKELHILEVGCGTGATLLEIKNQYRNAKVYGIELCESPAKIAQNIANVLIGNIETTKISYEKKYFDYIILGDVLEHLNNPWDVLHSFRDYIKKDGSIIASIPNIMHVSVLRELICGNFTYAEWGILDKTHLRFFTLSEIQKLFSGNNYDINSVSASIVGLTGEDEKLIDCLCSMSGENMRDQYQAYQYKIKATYAVDLNRVYEDSDLIDLKYRLIRIDNEIDIESSLEFIFNIESKYGDEFIDYARFLIDANVINKSRVLNRIGVEAYNIGLYELCVSIFMLSLEFDRNDVDTIYNIISIFNIMGENEIAMDILENSNELVKGNSDIQELMFSFQ
ncbi:bifunctional glycosyltransferase family 2 protein/class I SAM-dependent methyltransferase [Clostridioides sp. ZZV15-6598]|uniref:glycosyltransferase n=1 Tax=Clostridioides sp. ZZV15-6598 TaxID=2811501 RepID=UPI001D10B024|nr:glycosyltransferase [Clostridioides sp. ZZV15-6598]